MVRRFVGVLAVAGLALQSGAQGIVGDWPDLRKYIVIQSDFYGVAAAGGLLVASSSGAGTGCLPVSIDGGYGIWECSSGTTITGQSGLSGVGAIQLGIGAVYYEDRVQVSDLSDGTETFVWIGGLSDTLTDSGVDAVGFRYAHTEQGGEFVCYTRSNSTESTADSNVAVAADTWYRRSLVVNAAGTLATFSINGASVCGAGITTNIPTGFSR